MRKPALSFFIFFVVTFSAAAQTVYVNANSSTYHLSGCTYKKSGSTSMQITNARSLNFSPCSTCKPEGSTFDYTSHKKNKKNSKVSKDPKKETTGKEAKKKEATSSGSSAGTTKDSRSSSKSSSSKSKRK